MISKSDSSDFEPSLLLDRPGHEALVLPARLVRQAAAVAGLSDVTAVRLVAGHPGRGGTLARLIAAFRELGRSRVAEMLAVTPAVRNDTGRENVMTGKGGPAGENVMTGKVMHAERVVTAKNDSGNDA
jgi:hypothetical protein